MTSPGTLRPLRLAEAIAGADAKKAADGIGSAREIKHAREHFGALSAALIPTFEKAALKDVHFFTCAMVKAPPGAPSMLSPGLVAACVDAQQQVAALPTGMNGRLEEARQANNAQQIRAALADLQAALVEIRTRAGQCSPLQKGVAPGTPMVQPAGR